MKRCAGCKEEKGLDAFHRSKSGSQGRHAYCKVCMKAYSAKRAKAYYAANSERIKERVKQWAKRNPERCRVNQSRWRDTNRDEYRRRAKEFNKSLAGRERAARYRAELTVQANQKVYARRKWAEHIDSLSSGYVASTLCAHGSGLKRSDIPQSLIEAKRVQLQIKRLLREKTK